MESIIIDMITKAAATQDDELAKLIHRLISQLAGTFNAPSTWREVGGTIAAKYSFDSWEYENLELWDFDSNYESRCEEYEATHG